jgi:endoglucanase
VNGVQKLAHRGPTLYRGQGCYLKLSNLHSAYGKASSVVHDRVVRGTTRDSVWPTIPPVASAPATPPPTPGSTAPLPTEGELAFYVDPNSAAKQEAQRLRQQGRFGDAALIDKIGNYPQARWFGSWNWDVRSDVNAYVSAAVAASSVPVLVAYNIPNRDCGGYSAGGSSSADAYRAWIRAVADGINGRKTMVILEPDALALNTCLSETDKWTRYGLLKEAAATLKAKGARVYLDAGHANWIGDADMAARLNNAGIAQADGFSLNVSNFMSTDQSVDYGNRISAATGWKHFVVDTGRNARGGTGEWCNPWGRGLGQRPTSLTGKPLVDAYLWIKRPGESDGRCNGGPDAGVWWLDYALDLARNAMF